MDEKTQDLDPATVYAGLPEAEDAGPSEILLADLIEAINGEDEDRLAQVISMAMIHLGRYADDQSAREVLRPLAEAGLTPARVREAYFTFLVQAKVAQKPASAEAETTH